MYCFLIKFYGGKQDSFYLKLALFCRMLFYELIIKILYLKSEI